MSKNLVVYFSASGITKQVAQNLALALQSDLFEIKPEVPYTNSDLNWMDKNSRTTIEMKDWNSRPSIVGDDLKIENFDNIFLGFPIWWYIAPTIINTFLEAHNFADKKIILFATSGGSGFGRTVENLKHSLPDSAEVVQGKIFNNNPDAQELKSWADTVL